MQDRNSGAIYCTGGWSPTPEIAATVDLVKGCMKICGACPMGFPQLELVANHPLHSHWSTAVDSTLAHFIFHFTFCIYYVESRRPTLVTHDPIWLCSSPSTSGTNLCLPYFHHHVGTVSTSACELYIHAYSVRLFILQCHVFASLSTNQVTSKSNYTKFNLVKDRVQD